MQGHPYCVGMRPDEYPGFEQLLNEWNQKLEQSGFKDIERYLGTTPLLKYSGTACRHLAKDAKTVETEARYYRLLEAKVERARRKNQFRTPMEQEIMTLFSQGMKQAEIKRALNIQGHRIKVYGPIHYYLKLWGFKK